MCAQRMLRRGNWAVGSLSLSFLVYFGLGFVSVRIVPRIPRYLYIICVWGLYVSRRPMSHKL